MRHHLLFTTTSLVSLRSLPRCVRKTLSILSLTGTLILANPLETQALLEGATVTAGDATIITSGATQNINQRSQKAIVDATKGNIQAGETLHFNHALQNASTLTRIHDINPTQIWGTITASNPTAKIFLINPNGVIFGAGSQVNVGFLIASTADISNQDFMAGKTHFNIASPNKNAMIKIEQGANITVAEGGLAAFVAPSVRNDGVIQAKSGYATLVSGQTATLDLYGDGLVRIQVTTPVEQIPIDANTGEKVDALVTNTGTIIADGGDVLLTAKAAQGVIDNAINMDGTIRAQTATKHGEVIIFGGDHGKVTIGGTIDASGKNAGEKGGVIHVLGEKINYTETAKLDVSGDAGGGTILSGGDHFGGAHDATGANVAGNTNNKEKTHYGQSGGRGRYLETEDGSTAIIFNPIKENGVEYAMVDGEKVPLTGHIPQAKNINTNPGATFLAPALNKGDGGKIVNFATGTTIFKGAVDFSAGPNGGDAGFIEVSGRTHLLNRPTSVTALSPLGRAGMYFIDADVAFDYASAQTALDANTDFTQVVGVGDRGVVGTGTLTNNNGVTRTVTLTAPDILISTGADIDLLGNATLNFNLTVTTDDINGAIPDISGPLANVNLTTGATGEIAIIGVATSVNVANFNTTSGTVGTTLVGSYTASATTEHSSGGVINLEATTTISSPTITFNDPLEVAAGSVTTLEADTLTTTSVDADNTDAVLVVRDFSGGGLDFDYTNMAVRRLEVNDPATINGDTYLSSFVTNYNAPTTHTTTDFYDDNNTTVAGNTTTLNVGGQVTFGAINGTGARLNINGGGSTSNAAIVAVIDPSYTNTVFRDGIQIFPSTNGGGATGGVGVGVGIFDDAINQTQNQEANTFAGLLLNPSVGIPDSPFPIGFRPDNIWFIDPLYGERTNNGHLTNPPLSVPIEVAPPIDSLLPELGRVENINIGGVPTDVEIISPTNLTPEQVNELIAIFESGDFPEFNQVVNRLRDTEEPVVVIPSISIGQPEFPTINIPEFPTIRLTRNRQTFELRDIVGIPPLSPMDAAPAESNDIPTSTLDEEDEDDDYDHDESDIERNVRDFLVKIQQGKELNDEEISDLQRLINYLENRPRLLQRVQSRFGDIDLIQALEEALEEATEDYDESDIVRDVLNFSAKIQQGTELSSEEISDLQRLIDYLENRPLLLQQIRQHYLNNIDAMIQELKGGLRETPDTDLQTAVPPSIAPQPPSPDVAEVIFGNGNRRDDPILQAGAIALLHNFPEDIKNILQKDIDQLNPDELARLGGFIENNIDVLEQLPEEAPPYADITQPELNRLREAVLRSLTSPFGGSAR